MESKVSYPLPIILERKTPRLFIRPYRESDYYQCQALYSDPGLTHFFDHGEPRTKSEIDLFLKERAINYQERDEPFGLYSVLLKENHSFIGQVDVVPTENPGEVEIGWIFKKEFQNFGFCTEAVNSFLIPFIRHLRNEGFQVFGKVVDRIVATAHPENEPSKRIVLKAGLSYYKKSLRYGGKPRNWYELLLEKTL